MHEEKNVIRKIEEKVNSKRVSLIYKQYTKLRKKILLYNN